MNYGLKILVGFAIPWTIITGVLGAWLAHHYWAWFELSAKIGSTTPQWDSVLRTLALVLLCLTFPWLLLLSLSLLPTRAESLRAVLLGLRVVIWIGLALTLLLVLFPFVLFSDLRGG